MTLRFAPAAAGSISGALVITSNASNAPIHTVTLTGNGMISVPAISLSATMLDFGSVELGSSAIRSLTISNLGNAPLNLTGQSLTGAHASDYTIVRMSGTPIAPAGSDYIEIRFAPSATGVRTASLLISSNDPNTPVSTVSLAGSGTSTAQPHISVSQNTIDFGTTNPGTPVDRDLVISNTGTAALVLVGQNVSGTSFLLLTPAVGTIAPGGNSIARIRFDPPSMGSFAGTFLVSSNDPVSPTVAVSLHGVGGGSTGPRLALGATVLDFGAVPILQAKELDLEIRNIGTSDLVISSQLIAGTDALHFSIVQAAGSPVIPGGRTAVRVRHLPTSAGPKVALLRLTTNDPGLPTAEVALISTAVGSDEPPSPPPATRILGAYPNPFSSITTLTYSLETSAEVELFVYDIHGRVSSSNYQGTRDAGCYIVTFDGSRLPRGAYAVVLKAFTKDGRRMTHVTTIHCVH
ncbi:MAG: choice-of-anchor D domain-containing protein [Bacteroidota bacterium]|nr:choice-of-anchor D domain-containing protein [Bacteroidota bacterium]